MALADLRALARARVARVAQEEASKGNRGDGTVTTEIQGLPGRVAPVAAVARNYSEVERNTPAPTDKPAPAPAISSWGLTSAERAEGLKRLRASAPPLDSVSRAIDAEMVEALAEAMAANPVYQITDWEKALDYLRIQARRLLTTRKDPVALLEAERRASGIAGPFQRTR